MSLFAPTASEARDIAMAQQARAERLSRRVTVARSAVVRGECQERILWLLDHDVEGDANRG